MKLRDEAYSRIAGAGKSSASAGSTKGGACTERNIYWELSIRDMISASISGSSHSRSPSAL